MPTLAGYDQIVPGAAEKLVNEHLYGERVGSNAIRRLTNAESFAVVTGAVGAQILTIGGLVAAVVLVVNGYSAYAIGAIIPAILGASAQVVRASRKGPPVEEP
ncbi:hypothetical protein ACL9RL_09250 [Plantibacter sp. Mn2098]|uniref:hypothetical protein n=1 Tax=Plantibacter sp. Mn2098 TaxID=3395266 RepID=UPI003BC312C9